MVALDLPARDSQLLTACGEVAGGSAWADEMVPAVLARKNRDAEFGDAHGVFRRPTCGVEVRLWWKPEGSAGLMGQAAVTRPRRVAIWGGH